MEGFFEIQEKIEAIIMGVHFYFFCQFYKSVNCTMFTSKSEMFVWNRIDFLKLKIDPIVHYSLIDLTEQI